MATISACTTTSSVAIASLVQKGSVSHPSFVLVVMALVDEIMRTEGTGIPFGLSNNLLGWILFGVFDLIWDLYTVYTSGLDEDDEYGLSL
ncbi:Photosystem II reaction center W protein, chloroplastic [Capsicum annuum]|nr:Photosystem II reaction center W protein, chloroplastic [Capsicum annuum]